MKAPSQRHLKCRWESRDSNSGRLTGEPTLSPWLCGHQPCPGCQGSHRTSHTPAGLASGRAEQPAHLDLGQDGDDGDADAEREVEADEDLALVAGVGLGVVDKEQGHGHNGQRVEEEGAEEETWAGAASRGSGGIGIPTPSRGLAEPASTLSSKD